MSDELRTCHSLASDSWQRSIFYKPPVLVNLPPLSHWKIILVLSNFLTALSNTAWNLHCNCRAGWVPWPTTGKINQQRQTFSCIGRSSKKYHIEYTSKSLENKILSEILFFYKVLPIFMNFIQNNLLNQIKMSKKFVWNLKVLTAGLSIIKMSILLVLPFSSPEKILWAKKSLQSWQIFYWVRWCGPVVDRWVIIQTNYRPVGPGNI